MLEEAAAPAEADYATIERQLAPDPRWQALPSDEARPDFGLWFWR